MILKEGVNLAMTDALKLAEALVHSSGFKKEDALDSGVKQFEEEMFSRASIIAGITNRNMEDMLFTSGINEHTAPPYVRRMLAGEKPWLEWLIPLWFVKLILRLYFKW